MDNEFDKNLKEQFEKLPPELQRVVTSDSVPVEIQEIAKNNQLSDEQTKKLESEIYLILLGIEPYENLIENIQKNVGLSLDIAVTIAYSADDSIFKDVKSILENMSKTKIVNLPLVAGKTETETATSKPITLPTKEDVLSGIENPMGSKEGTISVSTLKSNNNAVALELNQIQPKENLLPEFGAPIETKKEIPFEKQKAEMPMPEKFTKAPINIGEKMSETVVMPKQRIVMEEKTKLPEKPKHSDVYREPIE
jgi:hypothetical protein